MLPLRFQEAAEANARTMRVEPNATALATAYHASSNEMIAHRRALIHQRQLAVGTDIVGQVRVTIDYGAFLDSEGLYVLLLIPEISWKRFTHPSDVLAIGRTITVRILRIAEDVGKITVSLKTMSPDPWEHIERRYPRGSSLTGRITSVMDYGVFVELASGIEGFVRLSEIQPCTQGARPSEVFSAGQSMRVRILDIEVDKRRIWLGLERLAGDPFTEDGEPKKI